MLTTFSDSPMKPQTGILVSAARETILERARSGLTEFSIYVDPNADPEYQRRVGKNPYAARHLRRAARFAQRITETPRGRGIIIEPPRHWKSSQITEKLPSKYLGDNPKHSIITVTNAADLANDFSDNVRSVINSERYQELYPNVRIRWGSNRKDKWALEGAYRYSYRAAGVGTNIMGGGANGLLVDDLFKDWQEGQSETVKNSRWDWLTRTAFNRLEPEAWVLVVCTRWAVDDHVGRIEKAMEAGGEHWEILNEAIDDGDPVTEGEPLWPERYSREEIRSIKNRPGATPFFINLVYYGKAEIPEGTMIKRSWFEYVPQLPEGAKWSVRPWDVAWTEKQTQKDEPDFTATCKSTVHSNYMYLGSPRLMQISLEDLAKDIVATKLAEPGIRFAMGKNANKATIVTALNRAGQTIGSYDEATDKVARASGWIPFAEEGRIKLVGTADEWEGVMAQLTAFPNKGAKDDAVDMISGAAQMQGFIFKSREESKKPKQKMPMMARRLRG